MTIFRTALLLGTLALAAAPDQLGGQELSFDVAAGVAVPVGGAARSRQAGPSARVGVERAVSRRWGVRLDGEWAMLGPRRVAYVPVGSGVRNLRATGLSLSGIVRPFGADAAPYLLVGVGAHQLQEVGGSRSPYGTTAALQGGMGFEGRRRGQVIPFVEGRALLHVTDYGSEEWHPTVYLPVVVGVRVR